MYQIYLSFKKQLWELMICFCFTVCDSMHPCCIWCLWAYSCSYLIPVHTLSRSFPCIPFHIFDTLATICLICLHVRDHPSYICGLASSIVALCASHAVPHNEQGSEAALAVEGTVRCPTTLSNPQLLRGIDRQTFRISPAALHLSQCQVQ